ncbi:hypothetical protein ACWDBW_07865 [Streptomyces sp. NPDC001107]
MTKLRRPATAFGAVLPFATPAALLTLAWLRLLRPRLPHRSTLPTAATPTSGKNED